MAYSCSIGTDNLRFLSIPELECESSTLSVQQSETEEALKKVQRLLIEFEENSLRQPIQEKNPNQKFIIILS